jgi:GT2 family glycosyltransferase
MNTDVNVVIAIATCNRSDQLASLLETLGRQQYSGRFGVIVVDNSAAGQDVGPSCLDALPPAIRARSSYETHTVPGIPSVRNQLVHASLRCWPETRWIAMIDDDEWLPVDWLANIVQTAELTNADVVCGPQIYKATTDAPDWFSSVQEIVNRYPVERKSIEFGLSTGNVLFNAKLFRTIPAPWFDPVFTQSGGSDFDFFMRASVFGAKTVFEPRAVTYEDCHGARLTPEWWRHRMLRYGRNHARVLRRNHTQREFVRRSLFIASNTALSIPWRFLKPRAADPSVCAWMRTAWLKGFLSGCIATPLPRRESVSV